jgi:hypothetical protein
MKLKGSPLNLDVYETSEVLTNKHFQHYQLPDFERLYLPPSMRPFLYLKPLETKEFIADDNRGAVSAFPSLKMDGTDFYPVKGVGSPAHPFSDSFLAKRRFALLYEIQFYESELWLMRRWLQDISQGNCG